MAVPILRGSVTRNDAVEWYPVRDNPPVIGDLLVMMIPATEPMHEPGWTRPPNGGNGAWRLAEGTETGFPFPTAWFTGVEVDTATCGLCKLGGRMLHINDACPEHGDIDW